MTTLEQMLMCHKVTHKNLTDSHSLFRMYDIFFLDIFMQNVYTVLIEQVRTLQKVRREVN